MGKYSEQEKSELEQELKLRDALEREREVSDRSYAIKLVERIVFILVGLLAVGVVTALVNSVIK